MSCEEALKLARPQAPDMPVVLSAAAAVLDGDGRVLLDQCEGAETWRFPALIVSSEMIPEYALMDLLAEGYGVETRPCALAAGGFSSHAGDEVHYLTALFLCRVWTPGAGRDKADHLKWMKPAALYEYNMAADHTALIDPLIRMM